jgi:PhoPQ-activated pathogenicity-related protein
VNVNKNVVKLVMINVCGLVKRIQYPEFMELIEGYDILCFVETKTDDADERLTIPHTLIINSLTTFLFTITFND